MKRLEAHWQILIALILASVVALLFRHGSVAVGFVEAILGGCRFAGDLFMRALKMLIVPLILTSVVSGITGLHGVTGFGRLGLKTAGVYLGTGLTAILLGLALVNLIGPGLVDGKPNPVIRAAFEDAAARAGSEVSSKVAEAGARKAGDYLDVFRSMLPENILHAATDNSQLLGVIVFGLLFAAAVTRLPAADMRTVREFFRAAHDAMILITGWVMKLAPLGVFALILR